MYYIYYISLFKHTGIFLNIAFPTLHFLKIILTNIMWDGLIERTQALSSVSFFFSPQWGVCLFILVREERVGDERE